MLSDADIAAAILALLKARNPAGERGAAGRSICPSEAARALETEDAAWRALMPDIRRVAARLAEQGLIEATQRGAPVDAERARGPIRLRLSGSVEGV